MAPQPRSQTSPPKPWEQRPVPRSPVPDPALMSNAVEGAKVDAGIAPAPGAGSLHPQRTQHRLVSAREAGRTLPGGVSSLESARIASAGASPAGGDARSRYSRGGAAGAPGTGTRSSPLPAGAPSGQAKNEQGIALPSQDGVGVSRMEGAANGVANTSGGTAAVANTTDGQQWKPQVSPGIQGTGAYGGYGPPGYGSGRYGTSYGTGYGSNYANGYSPGGYGGQGYGGYSSMYGGGYGGGYGGAYGGGYGNRYGYGHSMGGGVGGMGGMDQQYPWLHSINHFTSSLGYLTEMLGMNTQAIGFVFGNLMGFLEHVGQCLTSLQPWREFPPGHPRHGEPPPSPEEERRRLSRLRVLRFAMSIVIVYAGFRLLRWLYRMHGMLTGRRERIRPGAIAQASLEDIYRQQGQRQVLQGSGRAAARQALPWDADSSRSAHPRPKDAWDFTGVGPWD